MNRSWIVLSAVVLLAACGEEQKPYKPPLPQSGGKEGAVLFQPQREALDVAKGLGQVVEQGAKERAEAAAKAAQ